MNVDQFKCLAGIPAPSGAEDEIASYIRLRATELGAVTGMDRYKNVYVLKGNAKKYPCVAAHMDNVWTERRPEIRVSEDKVTAHWNNERVGYGADDKTGIQVCLELLEKTDVLAAVFFAREEIGMIGAKHVYGRFINRLAYMIEFDCPGFGYASYTCDGVPLFDSMRFANTVIDTLRPQNAANFQFHPYTDVKAIRQAYPELQCLNLASGYHQLHSLGEYALISEIDKTISLGEKLIKNLGTDDYAEGNKFSEPYFSVTDYLPTQVN
jgi:putative aminopeptidase FrvX